jgi:hypothetical protein
MAATAGGSDAPTVCLGAIPCFHLIMQMRAENDISHLHSARCWWISPFFTLLPRGTRNVCGRSNSSCFSTLSSRSLGHVPFHAPLLRLQPSMRNPEQCQQKIDLNTTPLPGWIHDCSIPKADYCTGPARTSTTPRLHQLRSPASEVACIPPVATSRRSVSVFSTRTDVTGSHNRDTNRHGQPRSTTSTPRPATTPRGGR